MIRLHPAHIPVLLLVSLLVSSPSQALAQQSLPNFVDLVEANSSAVVNISTTQRVADTPWGRMFPELPEDSPFNEYFRRFFGTPEDAPKRDVHSLGSGFIISQDGYILTNFHVVKDADKILAQLNDNRELPAKVIGSDAYTDVALLKIDASNLPTVRIGNSDELQVGQWVLAIGSPFGLQHTATQGIVSALGRTLPNESYVPFIQTDVAVNPGNSGGPLFNAQGNVIGVNAQIFSSTGGFMGLSFAIPINVAMDVAQQLREKGSVTRGWLGVYIQGLSQELAESFGLERAHGALVTKVVPQSPAAKAGLRTGDIIISYAGQKIEDASELPARVASTEVGKIVPITVLRKGQTEDLQVTIAKLQDEQAKQAVRPKADDGATRRLNIEIADIPAEQRKELGLGNRGVLVQDVAPGPAADAGLLPGDILLMLNQQDVTGAKQLIQIVRGLPAGKPVPVLVQRDGNNLFLTLQLPKSE